MDTSEFVIGDTSRMGIADLAEATNATFAGYFTPVAHTSSGFACFCRWFSIDLAQSVLLTRQDGRLAGLTMLGVRGERGWCGGFGIVPEFRGRGLAGRLADALIERARVLKLRTLQLEVLVQNERAIRTYQGAGFAPQRDLVIFSALPPEGRPQGSLPPVIRRASLDEAGTLLARLSTGVPPMPCWQRELPALLTMDAMHAWTAWRAEEPVAVLLARLNPQIGQINIGHLAFTEEEAARTLLSYAAAPLSPTGDRPHPLFVLNEPEDSPLFSLMRGLGLRELHRQHEMRLTLD